MSANERGWVFTGGDYAIGVPRRPIRQRSRRDHNAKQADDESVRGEIDSGAFSLQIMIGAVISTFLADALPRSAA